jgi:protein SCO1/2
VSEHSQTQQETTTAEEAPVSQSRSGIGSVLDGRGGVVGLAAVGLLGGLLVAWLVISLISGDLRIGPPNFNGIVMQSPQPLSDFTLTDHNGQAASLSDFRGQVVLIYFGYTYCPDVCPATLSALETAVDSLGDKDREKVQVVMVSVDPERDTPEVLADYMAHFDPSFLGLTGTNEELVAAAVPLGIFFQKREGSVESGYLVDHTATVAAVDGDGYLRLIYPFNTPGEDIGDDLRHLID